MLYLIKFKEKDSDWFCVTAELAENLKPQEDKFRSSLIWSQCLKNSVMSDWSN